MASIRDLRGSFANLSTGPPSTPASEVKTQSHSGSAWSSGKFKKMRRNSAEEQRDIDSLLDDRHNAAQTIVEKGRGGSQTSLSRGMSVRMLLDTLLYITHLFLALGNWRFELDDDNEMPREGKNAILLAHTLHNK